MTKMQEKAKKLQEEKAKKLQEERAKKLEEKRARKLKKQQANKLKKEQSQQLKKEKRVKLKDEKKRRKEEERTPEFKKEKAKKLRRKRITKLKRLVVAWFIILLITFIVLFWKRNGVTKFVLENIVNKIAKAEISLTSIELTSQGIYLKDVEVESKTDIYYYAKTPTINIDMNYSTIIKNKFSFKEIVDSLYMETPVLKYGQDFGKEGVSDEEKAKTKLKKQKKKDEKSKKEDASPFDITNYVRKATITQGELSIDIGVAPYFRIMDTFTDADITFDNRREETVQAKMTDNRNHPLGIGLVLNERGFASVELTANGYNPDSLFVTHVDDLQINLVGKAKYSMLESKDSFLDFDLTSDRTTANIVGMELVVNNLKINGTSDLIFVKPESASFMGIPCQMEGALLSLFDQLKLDARASVDEYQIGNSYDFLKGIINAEAHVNGYAQDPLIQAVVNTKSLELYNFEIRNIDAKLEYQNYIKVDLLNATVDKNTINGSGFIEKNFVSADLFIKNKEESIINLQGNLLTKGIVIDDDAYFKLSVSDLALGYGGINIKPLFGLISLDKDMITGYLINEELTLEIESDLTFNDTKAKVSFLDYHIGETISLFQQEQFATINPLLNGSINLGKQGDLVDASLDLEITAFSDQVYLPLKTDFRWDLVTTKMSITNKIMKGKVFDGAVTLAAIIDINSENELDAEIIINEEIMLKGRNLLNNDRVFKIDLEQISLAELKKHFPQEMVKNFPNGYVTLNLDYFYSSDTIRGELFVTGLNVAGFSGYGMRTTFGGSPELLVMRNLAFYNERQVLLRANGTLSLKDGLFVNADALIKDVNFADYQNVIPFQGYLNADLNFRYNSKEENKYSFRVQGVGSDFRLGDFDIDDVYFNALYLPQKLHIDNLYLNSTNFAGLTMFGDFTYDIFKNEYIPSAEKLYLRFDADAYKVLSKLMPDMIEDGDFVLRSEFVLGINEEGLQIYEGYLRSRNSYLKVAEQPELIDKININAVINDSKLDLETFSLNLGDGNLHISNTISDDNDNFFVGGVTLGQFRVFTSQRGILVHIPQYMPIDESALIKLSGTRNNYALIKGPFDDMKIDAEVTFSNGSVIYPPKTDNLLSIITSASKSTFKKKKPVATKDKSVNNALPFDLNARLIIGENVRYVTYPTNILLTANSYLKLAYHGGEWSVPEAKFLAEEGTITFLDTDLNVDLVEILINEIELSLDASFTSQVQDGSTVTLRISNGQSNKMSLDDLKLTVSSDNPEDKTQSQAINRLRYSGNQHDMDQAGQSSLQDEAVLMLGSNVDNTFFNDFLRPVETFFRRRLRLDYFSIRPGFVKNMLNTYVVGNGVNNAQEVSDSELTQFSSSILLNNLSVNLGRPIYKRFYFNYTGLFQEITNLDRDSKTIYEQDFQIRANVDFKTKVSYTFKHRPSSQDAHEVMIFHSLSF